METPILNIIEETKQTEADALRKAGYSEKAVRLLNQQEVGFLLSVNVL